MISFQAVAAQGQLQSTYDEAYTAWDSGEYTKALELFAEILNTMGGDSYLEKIALVTGELFHTMEVAPDGRSIKISQDGRFASYETTVGNSTVTHISSLDGDIRYLHEFRASNFIFSPSGDIAACFMVDETRAIRRARTQLETARGSGDRTAISAQQGQLRALEVANTRITVIDLNTFDQTPLDDNGLLKASMVFGPEGNALYLVGGNEESETRSDIYSISRSPDGSFSPPVRITGEDGFKTNPIPISGGKYLIYTPTGRDPLPRATGGQPGSFGRRRGSGGAGPFTLLDLTTGDTHSFIGVSPLVSADGSTLAFQASNEAGNVIDTVSLTGSPEVVRLLATTDRLGSMAIAPDGSMVAFEITPEDDREIYLVSTEGGEPVRLTREIMHDYTPRFLDNETVMAFVGESRHRRSFLYDVSTSVRTRLFHNNTIRTIAPEYEWDTSADGTKILICSDRDGDTITPERGVYLVDRTRKVTKEELLVRIDENLAAERSLRRRGRAMFAPVVDEVRRITNQVSMTKIYEYEKALYDFDSKNASMPGNRLAGEYIFNTLKSFGYEPEYQWFTRQGRGGGQEIETANVIATLKGTENPELIYVLSSHYDSATRSPGADDNTSSIAVLLEAARVLAETPMSATIIWAAFTGEESGLWGSAEFVNRAVENGDNIVGAINNDMIGWSNDHRLDNTIRFANAGIRDLQHASSFLFSNLITYDSKYYRSTDAARYYEAYGEMFGGIGSHPIVASPFYHQTTDQLETVNHEQIFETCKSTVASMMLLASSPAMIKGLELVRMQGTSAEIRWTASPESGISSYKIVYGPAENPDLHEMTVNSPGATLPEAGPGTMVKVRAINNGGLHGWDWARLTIER